MSPCCIDACRMSGDKNVSDQAHTAPTLFLQLMAQYNGQAGFALLTKPAATFPATLTVEKLLCKALRGDDAPPIRRIEEDREPEGPAWRPSLSICLPPISTNAGQRP